MPKVPFRMLLTRRRGSGKTVTISSLVLDHYRGCFEAVYIFSSTAHLDPTFKAIAEYVQNELGQGKTDDPASIPFIYAQFDASALRHIIVTQMESLQQQTEDKQKTLRAGLIMFDDLSHDGEIRKHQAGVTAE